MTTPNTPASPKCEHSGELSIDRATGEEWWCSDCAPASPPELPVCTCDPEDVGPMCCYPPCPRAIAKACRRAERVNAEFGSHVVLASARELEKLGALVSNWKKTTDECFDLKDAQIAKLTAELATLQAKHAVELANLNLELGKAQGELEGLRAGWSVSNHEAWEQGWRARATHTGGDVRNPFPKPEKKESGDGPGR